MITLIDRNQRRSSAILLVGLLVLLLALGARLLHLNVAPRPALLALAERQKHSSSVIPARRGMILDTRGRVVALSRQVPDVFVDPWLANDVSALAADVAARASLPLAEVEGRIRRRADSRFVVVAPQVDRVTATAIRDLGHPAVGLTDRAQRFYPLGGSMSQVLGWVGHDGAGLEGIELAFDHHLGGQDGRRATIRDARRRAIQRLAGSSVPPVDGGHVVLTLDAEIQLIAEESLARAIMKFEAESGIAIVMSPINGAVLAMVSLPASDLNEPYTPEVAGLRRNRAVTDPVEPGSAFKPVIVSAALEFGFVTPMEIIDCGAGSHRFGRRVVRDTKPNGPLDLRGIITRSSNIGMGIIGTRMGNDVLYDTLHRFGFGERSGIECPGEGSGLVRQLKDWTSYSTTSVPMGYEILVTPLQLINAFAAIVNDGILVKPRLVRMLLGPDGQPVQSFESPDIIRRVTPSQIARYVARELLVSVVENGGGRQAEVGPYRVLGKTGTAKLTSAGQRGYEARAYLGVFVGAAPVTDPQIVALAMVRRPNPAIGYYGRTVAAPVVGDILVKTLTYLEVPPDKPPGLADL